jgi:hypothetical protein
MPNQSSMHLYLNWAKERIDEMDAILASLEVKAGDAKAESKVKVDALIADLKQRRGQFQSQLKQYAAQGEAALEKAKSDLKAQWTAFEGEIGGYLDKAGKQFEQGEATFKTMADAQAKAWREAASSFRDAASKIGASQRADLESALKQMEVDASEAQTRLHKLKQAGSDSWSTLSAALAESRKAFDQANQAAWDALRGSKS